MKIFIIAVLSLATCCYAQEKMTVTLNDGGYTTSGGDGRDESVKIELHKGFGHKSIPVEEKIAALKAKLNFYELASKYKVDLSKQISAVYADKSLKSILAELLPNVPVKFDGVDSGVTVESMVISKTPLETVYEFLDAAAGVYFQITDQGITITAKPITK